MTKPFGEGLWKNVQSVRVTRDDGIQVPVRVDGEEGIRLGLDATRAPAKGSATPKPPSRFGSFIRRLVRRA